MHPGRALVLVAVLVSALGCRDRQERPAEVERAPLPATSAPPGPLQVPPSVREEVSFQAGFAPIVERVRAAVVNVSSVRFVRPPAPEPIPFFSDPFYRGLFGPGGDDAPHGRVLRGSLGVAIQDVAPALSEALGLHPDTRGALVSDVVPDSPAQKAGLQRGDVIISLGGQPVADSRELRMRIAQSRPGTRVDLRVLRSGRALELSAPLEELREPAPSRPAPAQAPSAALGIEAAPLSEDLRRRLQLPRDLHGVLVAGVARGGRAELAGLRPGDILVEVDGKNVSSPQQLKQQTHAAGDRPVALLVWRAGHTRYVVVEP
jgi:S1-C subfamily serine protease